MKVDDQQNKSTISPGKLVGLNVFSQFYVGGYSEYIPDLLPNGANFKNGFQGKAWADFTPYLLFSKSEKRKNLLEYASTSKTNNEDCFLIGLDQSGILMESVHSSFF